MSAVLEVKDAVFTYPGNGFLLNRVNFSPEPGKISAVLGPNGAGKSTLIKLMCGILKPLSGSVHVNGNAAAGAREFARAAAYIPQDDAPAFDFTVREIVEMGRRPYTGPFGALSAKDKKAVENAVSAFGLEKKSGKKYSALSGGERRMILLARAFAQDASMLLMDEPTTYLDIAHREALLKMISVFRDAGRSAVIITHDINLASMLADAVYIMKDGAVAASGAPEEVINEKNLSGIFGTGSAVVGRNPDTGKPWVYIGSKIQDPASKIKGGGS